MTQSQLTSLIEDKNLVIETLKVKLQSESTKCELLQGEITESLRQRIVELIQPLTTGNNIEEFTNELKVNISSSDYINLSVPCEKYGFTRIATLQVNKRYSSAKGYETVGYELRSEITLRPSTSDINSVKELARFYTLGCLINFGEELFEFNTKYSEASATVYKVRSLIDGLEREINAAQRDFDRSQVMSRVYQGSELKVAALDDTAHWGSGSRRNRFTYNRIKIEKMTPKKVTVEFYRDYMNQDQELSSYICATKRLSREDLISLLDSRKSQIISLNQVKI